MVVEQIDWMRNLQQVGQMIAVSTLVAGSVQVGERQRAKNGSPNLQRRRPSGAAHKGRQSVARVALLPLEGDAAI